MDIQAILVAGVLISAALLAGRWVGRRGALASVLRLTEALELELQSLRRSHLQTTDDYNFLIQFLRGLPNLTRSIMGGTSDREIPPLLVAALRRELDCSTAMVLLRRRATVDDPERGNRLLVAAIQPKESLVQVGAEIPLTEGELGFAATTQRVMSRHDFVHLQIGMDGDTPLVGDWSGSGNSKVGAFRPSDGTFYLDYNGNGAWDGCGVDRCLQIGMNGDTPLVGDWNGTGADKVGVFRPSDGTFYLDTNGNGIWEGCGVDTCTPNGLATDTPLVGEW